MRTQQSLWSADSEWASLQPERELAGLSAQLVLLFGGVKELNRSGAFARARSLYPGAHIVGCSTAGEIHGTAVSHESVAMTAIAFEHSRVAVSRVSIEDPGQSRTAAHQMIQALPTSGLRYVFILSDGLKVNGSQLVQAVSAALPPHVTVFGGFAGDGDRLSETYTWCDNEPAQSAAVAVGLYGDRLNLSSGVTGPWGSFGPDRLVTKSKGNVLYELDGRPALELYKSYLGEHASGLPASGLLFPLLIHPPDSDRCVLRALLGIGAAEQSITFAGEILEGSYARFMRGSIERLIGDTFETASAVKKAIGSCVPGLSILVSCNGRRHVLKQRLDEEIEAVDKALGGRTAITGFYSYGEIGPLYGGGPASLHNETMTITTLSEM